MRLPTVGPKKTCKCCKAGGRGSHTQDKGANLTRSTKEKNQRDESQPSPYDTTSPQLRTNTTNKATTHEWDYRYTTSGGSKDGKSSSPREYPRQPTRPTTMPRRGNKGPRVLRNESQDNLLQVPSRYTRHQKDHYLYHYTRRTMRDVRSQRPHKLPTFPRDYEE